MKDVDTLSYNHFTTEDFAKLEVIRLIDELMEKVEKERTFETHLA